MVRDCDLAIRVMILAIISTYGGERSTEDGGDREGPHGGRDLKYRIHWQVHKVGTNDLDLARYIICSALVFYYIDVCYMTSPLRVALSKLAVDQSENSGNTPVYA